MFQGAMQEGLGRVQTESAAGPEGNAFIRIPRWSSPWVKARQVNSNLHGLGMRWGVFSK